ncbi:MAG: polysaccharide biosynthesis tyrosine autokinase [Sphaerochaetaceae bacterium]|nr:polysaccharide biosynthesis tyrosine autokinase [Sphaerochaetaceae bacterium]
MDKNNEKNTNHASRMAENKAEQEISIPQLLGIVKQRRIWIYLFFILAVGLAFGYLKITNPTYQATATALVEPISNATSIESLLTTSSSSSKIDTEVQLITSLTNLQNALDKLDLSKYLNPDGIPYSDYEKPLTGANFKNSVSYSTVSNTKLVKITVTDGNPQFCADYANALLESYTELLTGIAKRSKSAQREFIEAQIPVTEVLLEDACRELSNYKETSGIVQMTEKSSLLSKKIASFQLMIEPLNYQLIENSSLMDSLNIDGSLPSLEQVSENVEIASLLEDLRANSKELIMYQNVDGMGDESRIFVLESSIDSKAKDVMNSVMALVGMQNSSYAKAVADYLCVSAKITSIQDMIAIYNDELAGFPIMEQEYLSYQRDVEIYESLLLNLKQTLEQTKMVEAAVTGNVNVVDSANVPINPVSPKKLTIMAAAVVGGVALGVLFGFFLEFIDNSIRSEDTIKTILGNEVPSLGWTPYMKDVYKVKKEFPALFVYNDPDSSISERFKAIANNIAYSIPEKVQVLSINSTDMNEGKTTVIVNVAASYALAGKKVILIDGDFRKPAIEPFFKLKRSKVGIVDAVIANVPLEKCIVRPFDEIPNLHILPPGRGTRNPNALYNSEKFGELVRKLKSVYDYVIIDCPPLSYGSEFTHLAKHLDGFVLDIRAGVAMKSSLFNFAMDLDFIQAPLLGYIYYGVVAKNQSSYGSYGHGNYGYGSYGGYGSKKYGYGYGYGSNKKSIYEEGKGSYKKIYKKELKRRAEVTYGKREPVLAYSNGLDMAFVSMNAERHAGISSVKAPAGTLESMPLVKGGIADKKTSDMLSDIENLFTKG